jgi:hypothetical protein
MAGLYVMGVLPGDIIYRHWQKRDLEIIPDIIIPMEEVLIESRNEVPGTEYEHLKILSGESDIDSIRRAWRRLHRRLSFINRSVRACVTGKPPSEVRSQAKPSGQ